MLRLSASAPSALHGCSITGKECGCKMKRARFEHGRAPELAALSARTLPALAAQDLSDQEEYVHGKLVEVDMADRQLDFAVFKEILFAGAGLARTRFQAPRLDTVRMENCDLANAEWPRLIAHRVEFVGCRMDGFTIPEAYLRDVRFDDCSLRFARIRFATLKSARFEHCDLSGADLQATDLTGAIFARCKLDEVEFSQAVLSGADLRTSTIERMRVGIAELQGAIVDPFQASYLAGLMGLVIKNEGE